MDARIHHARQHLKTPLEPAGSRPCQPSAASGRRGHQIAGRGVWNVCQATVPHHIPRLRALIPRHSDCPPPTAALYFVGGDAVLVEHGDRVVRAVLVQIMDEFGGATAQRAHGAYEPDNQSKSHGPQYATPRRGIHTREALGERDRARYDIAMTDKTHIGATPGLLVGGEKPTRMTMFAYGPERLQEREVQDVSTVAAMRGEHPVTWLDVDGPVDGDTLKALAEGFGLHALALEDVLHGEQRPKSEFYDDHIFMVVQLATINTGKLHLEQVGLFIGSNFVLTFQTEPGDPFDPVRERIRHGRGRIRSHGSDYLGYALIDAVVDHYFPVVEWMGDKIDHLEDVILHSPEKTLIELIVDLRHELGHLRRHVRPMREAVNMLAKPECPVITDQTRVFLRDLIDHAARVGEATEHHWEHTRSLVDMDVATSAQHLNEVMKVLTVISTIFIPLSFLAGLYGMNFQHDAGALNMPELHWAYGYPALIALMLGITFALLTWFRRKKWI